MNHLITEINYSMKKESLTQQIEVTTKEKQVNRGNKKKSTYVYINRHNFLISNT